MSKETVSYEKTPLLIHLGKSLLDAYPRDAALKVLFDEIKLIQPAKSTDIPTKGILVKSDNEIDLSTLVAQKTIEYLKKYENEGDTARSITNYLIKQGVPLSKNNMRNSITSVSQILKNRPDTFKLTKRRGKQPGMWNLVIIKSKD